MNVRLEHERPLHKILFFGAGVLGSLYAAKLHQAGYNVSILARGRRLADLREHGLVLCDAGTGKQSVTHVQVVEEFGPQDDYDLVVVPVRREQLQEVLPILAANTRVPSFLFMVCNVNGPDEMIASLGRGRVLLGYAGAGGLRNSSTISYTLVPGYLQKTMLGELDGRTTPRLQAIVAAFSQAGFSVGVTANMDAWLKTHVAWITPLVKALYLVDGDNYRLARQPRIVAQMVAAVRENLAALRALGVSIEGPLWVRMHAWVPAALLALVWRIVLSNEMARLSMAEHAKAARQEMEQVTADFRSLVEPVGPAPIWDALAVLNPL